MPGYSTGADDASCPANFPVSTSSLGAGAAAAGVFSIFFQDKPATMTKAMDEAATVI